MSAIAGNANAGDRGGGLCLASDRYSEAAGRSIVRARPLRTGSAILRHCPNHASNRSAQAVAAAPRSVAAATGQLLRSIVDRANIARLLVAGGDTSTLAIEALDIWGLSYRAPLVEGAPVCRAHSAGNRLDGLEIVLKGGQMGPPEFFRLASG